MRWTWDPYKNRENEQKHDIKFETAQLVFQDMHRITGEDPYPYEQRWRTTGLVGPSVIIVIHTSPEGGTGRIISARRATRHERRIYEEGNGQTY